MKQKLISFSVLLALFLYIRRRYKTGKWSVWSLLNRCMNLIWKYNDKSSIKKKSSSSAAIVTHCLSECKSIHETEVYLNAEDVIMHYTSDNKSEMIEKFVTIQQEIMKNNMNNKGNECSSAQWETMKEVKQRQISNIKQPHTNCNNTANTDTDNIKKNIFRYSGVALSNLIRNKKLSSLYVTAAYISQIVNLYKLNALVQERFQLAISEAIECDRVIAEGNTRDNNHLPLFYGVPCSIKEAFSVAGYYHTAGLKARAKNGRMKTSATCVLRMQKAGFIILGLTNTSELCMWLETSNNIYGTTNNPYDHRRTPGGSSGGEGALISACGSPCGLGSDVGGSIRLPSFFNGIFGHKPTGGVLPNTGEYPLTEGRVDYFCQPGPMCRYSDDLWPLLKLMAGSDGKSAMLSDTLAPWINNDDICPQNVKINELRVFSIIGTKPFMSTDIDDELVHSQRKLEEHFKSMGCHVQQITVPQLLYSIPLWGSCMSSEQKNPFRYLLAENNGKLWLFYELVKIFQGKSDFTIPAIGLGLVEQIFEFDTYSTKHFIMEMEKLKNIFNYMFRNNDTILLYPPYTRPAPIHHTPLLSLFDFGYTAIFNSLEYPVTMVPLGLTTGACSSSSSSSCDVDNDVLERGQKGLPLGIQVVAGIGQDEICIAVANHLEKEFGGWRNPIE